MHVRQRSAGEEEARASAASLRWSKINVSSSDVTADLFALKIQFSESENGLKLLFPDD